MAHFARSARGHVITPLRRKFGLVLNEDPVFDEFDVFLEDRVKQFQHEHNKSVDGMVDEALYKDITGENWPELFERAVMFVSRLEDHGFFTTIKGDMGPKGVPNDSGGVTAGFIGFTTKSGSLLKVVAGVDQGEVGAAFVGNGITQTEQTNFKALVDMRDLPGAKGTKLRLAASRDLFGNGTANLLSKWRNFFRDVLKTRSGIDAQKKVAREMYFTPALEAAAKNHIDSDYGRVLAFSSHVQSGGLTAERPLENQGTERFRRQLAVMVRAIGIGSHKSTYEARHMQLAKGLGYTFIDLSRWGFDDPEPPAPSSRILSIPLSSSPQLQPMAKFETAARLENVADSRVPTPELAGLWEREYATLSIHRAEALEKIALLDELPLGCLVIGGLQAGTSVLSVPGELLTLEVLKDGAMLRWKAPTDLSLPIVPRMRNGLVIVYVRSGVRPGDSFGRRVQAAIGRLNGSAPLVIGWFGPAPLPGSAPKSPAETFFKKVKAAMAQGTLADLIAAEPEKVIQAWGEACHGAFAADTTFLPLWRGSPTKIRNKVESACAAIDPSGDFWQAVASPANGIFMERR